MTETSLSSALRDYEANGLKLITTMKDIHQHVHDKYRGKLDAAAQELEMTLDETMAGVEQDKKEVLRLAGGVKKQKQQWAAPGQGAVKEIDAMMKEYC